MDLRETRFIVLVGEGGRRREGLEVEKETMFRNITL